MSPRIVVHADSAHRACPSPSRDGRQRDDPEHRSPLLRLIQFEMLRRRLSRPQTGASTSGARSTIGIRSSLSFGLAVLLVASTIVLPARHRDPVELAVAGAVAIMLLTLLSALPRRGFARKVARLVPFACFVVIALLRDGTGGSSSGCEPLVLIPVLWVAMYEEIRWSVAATACVALSVMIPLVAVGGPDYSTVDWRRGVFLTALAAALTVGVRGWRQAHDESITDRLTGAHNRRQWEEQLPRLTALAQRENKPLTIAMLDLDRFKNFNDTYGHQAGDRLLSRAVSAWIEQLRVGDLLTRYGGEEFAIALYDCDGDQARDVVERARLATPEDQTCSAGVATLNRTEGWQQLVARADAALYEAKRDRNRTVLSTVK